MNGERLRLGAFGVGRMGQVHLEHLIALHQAGEIELVAIGDRFGPTLSSASRLLNELGGPDLARIARFDEPDAMAAAARLDGVIVASRTEDHARDSLAFIRDGTPVLVEKPFANSIAEAADFCGRLGDCPNRLVQVGFQRHFDAAGRTALDWISSGRIGSLQQSHHVLQDKNPTPVGYQSCGITADMAIHLVFEAMSVHGFELPSSVQALRFAAPHYDDRAGEGANVVHTFCTWADGTVAHLWGSRINSAGYDNGFKVIGTEGRIDVGEFVGDFGAITARLWSGAGDDRGGQIEEASVSDDTAVRAASRLLRPVRRGLCGRDIGLRRLPQKEGAVRSRSRPGMEDAARRQPRRGELAIGWTPIRPRAGQRIRHRDSC